MKKSEYINIDFRKEDITNEENKSNNIIYNKNNEYSKEVANTSTKLGVNKQNSFEFNKKKKKKKYCC